MIENTVSKCNENKEPGTSWIQKTIGNGSIVYVHLPSGQIFRSPKYSSKIDLSKVPATPEAVFSGKRELWPLPVGKSPFLNKQKILHHKDKPLVTPHHLVHDGSEKQNTQMEDMIVDPQSNSKWTEGSYESWKGAGNESTALDILTSWNNPMFLVSNEIAHVSGSTR